MAQVSGKANRFDPYRNFKFRVKWDGQYVAGFSKASGLSRNSDVIAPGARGGRSGPAESPGDSKYEAITLERGVTHDHEFERWANKVAKDASGSGSKDHRKDITVEVLDEGGRIVLSYELFRCWVSEFQAVPELDANAVAIEAMKLENEGWERSAVGEPTERGSLGPRP